MSSRVAPFSAEATALIVCLASAALFYLASRPRTPHPPAYSRWVFLMVILVGTVARWVLAWNTPGNYDRESWQIASDIFARGGNVYAETARYHYSPVWFWIVGLVGDASRMFPLVSFSVAVRLFLTGVDLATAYALWTWPRLSYWEKTRQAMFFYLNPVSFLLTGVHGAFDSLAVLFLVLAVRHSAHPTEGHSPRPKVWLYSTAALLVKQIVLGQSLILLLHYFKARRAVVLFALSCGVFVLSLWPYWSGAEDAVIRNVFRYRSYAMPYGLAGFEGAAAFTPLFAVLLCGYSFLLRDRRLSTKMLAGALFFLTFTTGMGVQYLVLPIALGALRVSRGFFVFTAVASSYLLGSYFNMGIPAFSWVPLWGVWITAAYWWTSVHSQSAKTA